LPDKYFWFVLFLFHIHKFHEEIEVKYEHGFATLSVPLPSRREKCQFTLFPATQTLADLVSFLEEEDKGTDHVAVYSLGTMSLIQYNVE